MSVTETRPRDLFSTVLISFFLSAFAGYLWIGKPRHAVVFALAWAALALPVLALTYAGWLSPLIGAAHLTSFASGWSFVPIGLISLVLVLPFRAAGRPTGWFSRWWGLALLWLLYMLVSGAIALGLRAFVLQPFTTPADSMQPTLQAGDYFFVSKSAYGYGPYSLPFGPWEFLRDQGNSSPQRGDIVALRQPQGAEIDYVERVVGLPGERIQMIGGVLHINGTPVKLDPAPVPRGRFAPQATFQTETLPEGVSYTIENQTDDGVADNTAEFLVPAGHYFVMGDNRDNSDDSRFQLGFVPQENIFGRAEVIFWNGEGVSFYDRRRLHP